MEFEEIEEIEFGGIKMDINLDNFSDIEVDIFEDSFSSRIVKPPKTKVKKKSFIKYKNAEKMANEIDINEHDEINCIVNGTFIFGDFIEAFIVKNNWHIRRMVISTLSMSADNIDSLQNLLLGGYIEQLDLIISGMQFSKNRNTTIAYAYRMLDIDNKFQLSVADCHTKICLIETFCGQNIVISGSANLSSSHCIEFFNIEKDKDKFDFYLDYHESVIEKFKTINKPLRYKELWNTIKPDETWEHTQTVRQKGVKPKNRQLHKHTRQE